MNPKSDFCPCWASATRPATSGVARLVPGRRLTDTHGFVRHLIPSAEIDELVTEFTDLKSEFETRRSALTVPYDRFHDIEGESMLLCYALVRTLQPETIVETGVGNGASTFFFLRALSTNGGGMLHSFDISDNVGGYLTKADRRTWDLQVPQQTGTAERPG